MSQQCTTADPCYPTATDDANLATLITGKLSYEIYDDSSRFADWEAWVDDGANSASVFEVANKDVYDGYVLKFQCDTSAANNPDFSACCIQADTNGGFCLENFSDGFNFEMFALTEDNFTTWAASPDIFSASHSSWNVDSSASSSIVGFQYIYCPEAADDAYTCYKFNPTSD